MSIELVAWALRQRIDDPVKVTLICLANRAKGPEGCWPKIRLIAEDTGKSERTIKRHIEALIEIGLITTERRKTYLIYRFMVDQEVTLDVTSYGGRKKCHMVAPQEVPSGDTSHKKEKGKKGSSSLRSEEQGGGKVRPIYSDEFQILWDMVPKDDNPGSKSEAAKAFNRLSKEDQDACVDGWMAYLDWLEAKRAKRAEYPILHCVTFINQRRWESLEEAKHG